MFNNRNKNFKNNNSKKSNRHFLVEHYDKKVCEPYHTCALCGKKIPLIAESLLERSGDGYVHFDCAIQAIRKEHNVMPPDKISYIGKGKFAVIEFQKHSHSFKIKEVVEWESDDAFHRMQESIEGLKK